MDYVQSAGHWRKISTNYTCVHAYLIIMCRIKHVGSGFSVIFEEFIVTPGFLKKIKCCF